MAELRESIERLLASKSESAKRGHREADVAFVEYHGACADLNELSRYVSRLEDGLRNILRNMRPMAPPNPTEQQMRELRAAGEKGKAQ